MFTSRSLDQVLWERSQDDSLQRLRVSEQNKNNPDYGIKSNALLVLSTYYGAGWFVKADGVLATKYLQESAKLGHSRACYELARSLLEDKKKEEALHYIELGLEKIGDQKFDCQLTSHNQESMKDILISLKSLCENMPKQRPTL